MNEEKFYHYQQQMLENSRQEAIERGNYGVAFEIGNAQTQNKAEQIRNKDYRRWENFDKKRKARHQSYKGFKHRYEKPITRYDVISSIRERCNQFDVIVEELPYEIKSEHVRSIQYGHGSLFLTLFDTVGLDKRPLSAKIEELNNNTTFTIKKKVLDIYGDTIYTEVYNKCKLLDIENPEYSVTNERIPEIRVILEVESKSYE